MKPNLIVIVDRDWDTFVKHKTNAAYERYGILPGGFYDDGTDTVYMSERMWRATMAQAKTDTGRPWVEVGEGLTEHELGHAWKTPGEDHPTETLPTKRKDGSKTEGGFLHALKCGFDTRAYTRLLRWRWNKAIHDKSRAWVQSYAQAWDANLLVPKPASQVK